MMGWHRSIRTTRGVTLVEMLVTMVVASVVLGGLGVLYTSAAGDFRRWSQIRESRVSVGLLESELYWKLRTVPPEGFRFPKATFDQAQITVPGIGGTPTIRDVLTYYYRTDQNPVSATDWAWSSFRCTFVTGIVFQYEGGVFRREVMMRADEPVGGGSVYDPTTDAANFNTLAPAQLQVWVNNSINRDQSQRLAINVDNLDFTSEDVTDPALLTVVGSTITWDLTQVQ